MISRRSWCLQASALALLSITGCKSSDDAIDDATAPLVEVWKTPSCGCCTAWVEHLRAHGFQTQVHDVPDTAPHRARLGIPVAYASCHSATVGGYALEGHVPAADIKALLASRPDAVGLSVPNMPIGSPGMEQGDQRDPYDVLLVQRDGSHRIFSSYRG